jgi:hypothetical protein
MMRQISLALVALCSTLAVGCGGPIFFVEVEVPEVCKAMPGLGFPSSPIAAPITYEQDLPYDAASQLPFPADTPLDPTVNILRVKFTLTEGPSDFSFINSAAIQARTAVQTTKFDIATYDNSGAATAEMNLEGNTDTNIMELIREGDLIFSMKLDGTASLTAWASEVQMCLRAAAKVDYLDAAMRVRNQ